ncbi:hypothetical protein [Tumebacillus flagellatus]|uniref:Uncharacterized protein n=1 Tax=Tumebacillus flagellatus TaxID=1157490 RepID=A0A074LLH9_9BACL|nr:hypothetical protein [Tumebacillus flagellatus]KEO81420.1 hypothetical protein EL26_21030 [Tumebacillus flagellatus]
MNYKTILTIAMSTMLLSSAPAFGAESKSAENNFSSTTFTQPHAATDAELAQYPSVDAKVTVEKQDKGYGVHMKKPQDPIYSLTSPNWSYTGLYPGSYIDTIATYTLSTSQQVVVKAVQYPTGVIYAGRVATADYQLVAQGTGVTTNRYTVNGNYDSSAVTFSFYNVYPGTYKLRIFNTNTNIDTRCDISGNGYVYYY